MKIKRLLLLTLFLTGAVFAAAQAEPAPRVSFEARVDRTVIDITEDIKLTLTLRASTNDFSAPQMPSLPNFNIYFSGDGGRTVELPGGIVDSLQIFYYTLSPRFAGKSTIGSFTIRVGGGEYKTEPIEVEVKRASAGNAQASLAKPEPKPAVKPSEPAKPAAAPQPAPRKTEDFFMTATADKTEAWLNEQINLIIRFYQSQATMGNPQYTRPKMEGLVFEEIKTSQGYEIIEGEKYLYTEFELALFGIVPGAANIGSATVDYVPQGLFAEAIDMFFGGATGRGAKRVITQPLKINIKPLPKEGRPQSFFGAVGGDFGIIAAIDNPAPRAGEPFTLTVTISGNGNIKAIGDMPAPDLGPSFRVYETAASSTARISGNIVGGSKVYKTVIVPRVSGKFTIPVIEFTYFDASSSAFRTIRTEALDLEVAPAQNGQDGGAVSYAPNTAPRVEQINKDIAYIKEGAPAFSLLSLPAAAGVYNYGALLLILIAVLGLIMQKGYINLPGKNNALREAKKVLSRASDAPAAAQALSAYLEARLGGAIGIKTVAEVAQTLALPPQTRQKLEDIWQELEMLKYAPASAQPGADGLSKKTLEIIKEIERSVK